MSTVARHRALPPRMEGVFEDGRFVSDADRKHRSRLHAVALWAVVVLATCCALFVLVFQQHGGRWFIVQSPSMGRAAPVGTLVVTQPVAYDDVQVGDVITFHPPSVPAETYTHRVIAITSEGISTRGDINGSADPWMVGPGDVIGQVTTILPGAGWALRALPLVVIGCLLIALLAQSLVSRTGRAVVRVVGFSLVVSVASVVLRPFAGLVVLATTTEANRAVATVVSTGLLPIRVTASSGGPHADLVAGQVTTLAMPMLQNGHYSLTSALNLGPIEWAIGVAVCLIPLAWCVIVGLPRREEVIA